MKSTLPADENKRANWIIRPVNKQSPREGSIQDHTRNHSYHLRTFGRDISNIQDSKRLQKQPTPTAPAKIPEKTQKATQHELSWKVKE
jgi:hypothetical protein